MDFASKFFYQLDEFQDATLEKAQSSELGDVAEAYAKATGVLCNVDIYVVRPIIRLDESDPSKDTGELFYLFMNEIPWTTAEQFGEAVQDVEDWERTQQKLEEEDPKYKYHKPEDDEKNSNSAQQQQNSGTAETNSTTSSETTDSNTDDNTVSESESSDTPESSDNSEPSDDVKTSNNDDVVANADTPE
jgi:hypothetical protein